MIDRYIKKILDASVYDVAEETPLDPAPLLSSRLGQSVWLKREDLQPIFSFKIRGAYNRIAHVPANRGVVTASAGNHAQGVALAARRLGLRAVIVMSENTPAIKVNAVAQHGPEIVLTGESFDEAAAYAAKLAADEGLEYIHPFDDDDVIAGQGTIGMELRRQHTGDIDAVFVPVGGGGLIAGIGAYIKYLRPGTRVIGVEAEGSDCMARALAAGRRVSIRADELEQFADGTAVRQAGKRTFRLAQEVVDDVITVSVDEICAAIKDIFEETRVMAEPAGALALAGLKRYAGQGPRKASLVAIVSGANVNFDRLRHISERTEVGEKRELLLGVTIPEKPGAFRRFCRTIGKRAVTEFNYRYADASAAHVLVGLQTDPASRDRDEITSRLARDYKVADLSDNEVAILHVRHMVGGRAAGVADERLYRFEFPEKPGALLRFLEQLGDHYNISMFHYRNHGSAYGRVLAGIQVPPGRQRSFRRDMDELGFRYWDETDNAAYQLFLG